MAIFSLCHRAIGRSTHRAGTAGAHAAYITRRGAACVVIGQHMPTRPAKARAWLDAAEQADRKNARVIDKIMVALPLELDAAQREALIKVFIRHLSADRVPWLAAIHDTGKDAHNPHAHIILRDRDTTTGQRFVKLSDKDSTQRLRLLWEACLNRAMEALGSPQRVSRLSLEVQGLARLPERHRGTSGHIAVRLGLGRTYGSADAEPVRPMPSRTSFPYRQPRSDSPPDGGGCQGAGLTVGKGRVKGMAIFHLAAKIVSRKSGQAEDNAESPALYPSKRPKFYRYPSGTLAVKQANC